MAQWIEYGPLNQKDADLILFQGTCLGCRPGPKLGACKRQQIDVSLALRCFSPSLSPFLSLSLKINKKIITVPLSEEIKDLEGLVWGDKN